MSRLWRSGKARREAIAFNSTSRPQHYVMLSQIIFGVVREFGPSEMDSAAVTQEINPISIEMAANALEWTLRTDDDADFIFQKKQPMTCYDDSGLVGVFYVDTAKQRNTGLYDIDCVDAVSELDNSAFAAKMYTGQSAKSVLEEILAGEYALEISDTLAAETIHGIIPDGTRRDALHMVAFRLTAAVDTSRSDCIRVFRCDISGSPDVIADDEIFSGGSVETEDIVTAVRLTAHTYTVGSSGADVADVGGVSYIHTTSTVTVNNPNAAASDLPNVIEITDRTIIDTSCAADVAAAVLAYYERRSAMTVGIMVAGRRPGDRVTVRTGWGKTMTGNITKLTVGLQDQSTAEAEVLGT